MRTRADEGFAASLIAWHRQHGRRDMPWQGTRNPYEVWLSEIMLQQTQVATVIPYYQKFLARFPDLADLARAPVEQVMALWSGLGYYARARNLHRAACVVMNEHAGEFPRDPAVIGKLPGIGPSTANAIAVFCFGARAAILDGNVKRVLCRRFGVSGFPGEKEVDRELWRLAESLLPDASVDHYIQAQMDLGATVCTRSKPLCTSCPQSKLCVARLTDRVGELPQAKPRKPLPSRETRVLVMMEAGRVLLLARPPTGIWGGLMSLPELPEDSEPGDFAESVLGCELHSVMELPPIRHVFTHFRLTLHPLLGKVRLRPRAAETAGQHWLAHHELADAALPSPIRKLLAAAFSKSFAAANPLARPKTRAATEKKGTR